MTQNHQHTSSAHRLAAIMFTDIVGYTRLMGEDEQKAMQMLRKNRKIHQSIIEKYHGKWLKEMGDGTLASFRTASDAVYCAGELIQACEAEEIKLRIGIHEGEVIEEDGDIFGDGVNIASRLEPLADPGQILVSGPVHRNIKNKPGISSTFFKEAELKNVDDPVKVYQLSVEVSRVNFEEDRRIIWINKKSALWVIVIALILLIGYSLSDYLQISKSESSIEIEKSIAVLPFKNMSEGDGNLAFSDGQWEAILSNISQIADLKVISRQSMEQYRKSTKTARQIGEELGVSYLLEGSVQKYGNQTKITVQLINAENDIQLWSHGYTQEIENIFSLQSEIALKVANELEVRLSKNESAQISNTQNIDPAIYELYLSAKYLKNTYNDTRDSSLLAIAIERFSEVIQKAPNFAEPYVDLAMSFSALSFKEYQDTTVYLLSKALEIDEGNVNAHLYLGEYFFYTNNVEKGKNELERTLELDPNNMAALVDLGYIYGIAKDFKKAAPYLFRFMQVNPSMESDKFEDRLFYYSVLNTMLGLPI